MTVDDIRGQHRENMFLAMEWGFKAHEKGFNFEQAKEKFQILLERVRL